MADYRLSAQAISRGKGQSSVASAAYRSGAKLIDERTGEIHDYTRKQGVAHSEVMAPDGTPEWMHDRSQLWNAVEKIETRKNSQLAREIQLSLPHELDPEQRKELVRDYVQEQFVNQGMIADIAIHEPSSNGDDRNHHAHIMLTMRELTGEGFHQKKATEKARSWNSDDQLSQWREEWANHQNRALERHGHSSRVDHRSYEAQGVDREPTQHLGPMASDMERKGKASRIGDENRKIANDNRLQAQWHAQEFELEKEIEKRRSKFEKWAEKKQNKLDDAERLKDLDFEQRQDRKRARLDAQLAEANNTRKATIKAELEATQKRLESKGVRKLLRNVFGRNEADKKTYEHLQTVLKNIKSDEAQKRKQLDRELRFESWKHSKRSERRSDALKKNIGRNREGKRRARFLGDKPDPTYDQTFEARDKKAPPFKAKPTLDKQKPLEPKFTPTAKGIEKPLPTPANDYKRAPAPTPAPVPKGFKPVTGRMVKKTNEDTRTPTRSRTEPEAKALDDDRSIDDRGPSDETGLDAKRGDSKKAWESSLFSDRDSDRKPWESEFSRKDKDKDRDRDGGPSPSPFGGGSGGKS